jgi:hypothetical protein
VAAGFLTCLPVGELVEYVTARACAGLPRPLTGASEALMHLGHFCMFARETLLLGVVLWYFRSGRGLCTAVAVGTIAWIVTLDYPRMSGRTLQLYYTLGLGVAQGAAWTFGLSREIPRMLKARSTSTVAEVTLVFWCLATLLPMTNLMLLKSWSFVQFENVACSTSVLVVHLLELRKRSSGSAS